MLDLFFRLIWGALSLLITTVSGLLAYIMVVHTGSDFISWCAVLMGLFLVSVTSKAAFLPKHTKWRDWWFEIAAPANIGKFMGQSVLVRSNVSGINHFYDSVGNLVGVEIDIPGDPPYYHSRQIEPGKGYRLHWLARRLSPKLPAGNQADVLTSDDTVVGHTTYKCS